MGLKHEVKSCPRCGEDHGELEFTGLERSVRTWFAVCPKTQQPILCEVRLLTCDEIEEARKIRSSIEGRLG